MELIDIHVHCGWYNNRFYDPERTYRLLTSSGVTAFALASTTAQLVAQNAGNNEVLRLKRTHPDKVIPLIWVSPYLPSWQQEAEQRLGQGFSGVKIDPWLGRFRVELHFLSSVFEFAQDNELPIFSHAYPGQQANGPEDFVPLLRAYPDVTLVLACPPCRELFDLAKQFTQVRLDTSLVQTVDFAEVLEVFGAHRLLWGSAYPLESAQVQLTGSPIDYQQKLHDLQQAVRTRDEFRLVTFENASSLFRTPTLIS